MAGQDCLVRFGVWLEQAALVIWSPVPQVDLRFDLCGLDACHAARPALLAIQTAVATHGPASSVHSGRTCVGAIVTLLNRRSAPLFLFLAPDPADPRVFGSQRACGVRNCGAWLWGPELSQLAFVGFGVRLAGVIWRKEVSRSLRLGSPRP